MKYLYGFLQGFGLIALGAALFLFQLSVPEITVGVYLQMGIVVLCGLILINWGQHREFFLDSIRAGEVHVPIISWTVVTIAWPVAALFCVLI